ncbi:MAG: hypothetical protein WD669_12140 [Pirellulales bacterium]
MQDDTFSNATILDIFTQETQIRGGRVTDTFHDGRRLFVRSLLPRVKEIRPQDGFQGGLALRAIDGELWLHPYLFRQVCRNGAIMAQALESVHLEPFDIDAPEVAASTLRDAIAACNEEEVFLGSLDSVRSSIHAEADMMLNMMPFLSRLQQAGMGRILAQILETFSSQRDRTRYGLMNAVTSVARDTTDPDERWRLEELGGSIGAGVRPRQPVTPIARRHFDREYAPARM